MKLIAKIILSALIFVSCNAHKELRIMSYNIRNAIGMDGVTDYKRIADVINLTNAGIIAIQEIDSVTERSQRIFVLEEIAKQAKMEFTFNASIPFQGGKYGIGILSKKKPVSVKSFALPGREEARSLLVVEFENYVVCCTHFSLNSEDRLLSVPIINEHTKDYKKPVFLAGDLNAKPSSEPLSELQKTWQILTDTTKFTFSANNPRACIDYIFVRKTDKIKGIRTEVIDEKVASDHLPVCVDVVIY